jgi:hypothetical protein
VAAARQFRRLPRTQFREPKKHHGQARSRLVCRLVLSRAI